MFGERQDLDDLRLEVILDKALEVGASDIILRQSLPVMFKVHGSWYRFSDVPIEDMTPFLHSLDTYLGRDEESSLVQAMEAERGMDLDFSFGLPSGQRFRVNLARTSMGPMITMRLIRLEEPNLEDLGFRPQSIKAIQSALMKRRGLILVTGVTGSGKSTTLAAMVSWINENFAANIVTIEDPIEFVFVSKRSIIHQREVGSHTESFARALKSAMRQAPDVIMVGEMRDPETIKAALTASETGHLVLSTLHTRSAPETILRVVDALPAEDKPMARQQLSFSLSMVISQKLVPSQRGGMVLAYELLVATDAIRSIIAKGEGNFNSEIRNQMRAGSERGMFLLEQILADHVSSGTVLQEVAENYANDPEEMKTLLKGFSRSVGPAFPGGATEGGFLFKEVSRGLFRKDEK